MDAFIRHYRLIEKLGSGGMGVVYRAEDTLLKRIVALKFPPEGAIADEQTKRRFLREAQSASALEHPNICSIHSVEEAEDGRLFICMSWCDGETLRRIADRGTVRPAEAIDIVLQVARGLEAAHGAGIVHRDIKPANIMISPNGLVRILDFGIAQVANATRLTKSGATLGTVHYMSPEQVRGDPVDPRSDIWSLGVVLYELLTGTLPFEGEYEASVLYAIVNDGFEPASRRSPAIPSSLDALLERALNKKPAGRYASIMEMILDLEAVRSELASPTGAARRGFQGSALLRQARRRPIAIAAVCAVAAAAALLAIFGPFATRERPWAAVIRIDEPESRSQISPPVDELLTARLGKWPGMRIVHGSRLRELRSDPAQDSIRTVGAASLFADRAGAGTFIIPMLIERSDSTELYAHMYDTATRQHILSVVAGAAEKPSVALPGLVTDVAQRIIDRSAAIPALSTASARARKLFADGERLYLHGDPQAGIPLVERALREDSTLIAAYLRLALWYRYENRRARALACAQKAALLSKGDPVLSLRSKIIRYRIMGRPDSAAAAMKRCIDISPPNPASLAELAYVYYHDQRSFKAAIPYLTRALDLDPRDIEGMKAKTLDGLGHAYMYLGRYVEADKRFRDHIALDTLNFDAIHSLATLNRMRGNYDAAEKGYNRVKELKTDYFPAYDELALTYLAIGKWRRARSELDSYRDAANDSLAAKAFALEGFIYFVQEDHDEAARLSRQAIQSDSLWIPAQWLLGRIALEHNRLAEAREALDAISRRGAITNAADDSAYVHNLEGWLFLEQGRTAEGIHDLELSPRLSLQNAMEFRKDLIRGLLQIGRIQEAERRALDARSFNARDAELLALLGDIYARKGDRHSAARYYEQAHAIWIDADPDFAPLLDLIPKLAIDRDNKG